MKSFLVLDKPSQIKALSTDLIFEVLKELIKGEATCQQLSVIFGVSKQKIHYYLKRLISESLIEVKEDHTSNQKEKYYRATAKNYILDFSLGSDIPVKKIFGREVVNTILENEHRINLSTIAAKLLDDSLKVKADEKLLIITGHYNMPLVEKLLVEAARRNVKTTLHYQGLEMYKAMYEEFSLNTVKNYLDNRHELWKENDVILLLTGETSHLKIPADPLKRELEHKHNLVVSRLIKEGKNSGTRVALMIGLLLDNLSESNFNAELRFWKSMDIDYAKLRAKTWEKCEEILTYKQCRVLLEQTDFTFTPEKIVCEYGSFGDCPHQSPLINLPGGEILIIPHKESINGVVSSARGYIMGKTVNGIRLTLKNNEIVDFTAETNLEVLEKAIEQGGQQGREVSLICLGTNDNFDIADTNPNFRCKIDGTFSIYWGNNTFFNGDVKGIVNWFVELDDPEIVKVS